MSGSHSYAVLISRVACTARQRVPARGNAVVSKLLLEPLPRLAEKGVLRPETCFYREAGLPSARCLSSLRYFAYIAGRHVSLLILMGITALSCV